MKKEIEWEDYDEVLLDRLVVEEVEKEIGFTFPERYKECVIKYHGTRPIQDLFDVGDVQRVFGNFFDYVKDENCSYTLLECYVNETDEEHGIIPKNVVPFADDPSGNYICFDYEENLDNPRIVFLNQDECISFEILDGDWEETDIDINEYDSEREAMEKLQRKTLKFVANSFDEFLDMLYEEE